MLTESKTSNNSEEKLLFSLEEFHANPQVLPASDEAKKITVGSGRQCALLLESSSPLGAFSKILMESSAWTSSEEYCYVWERLDTKFGCSAYQLTQLGQSTSDTECSLWQTPMTTDAMPPKDQEQLDREIAISSRRNGKENGTPITRPSKLRDEVMVRAGMRLWRTPDANCQRGSDDGEKRLRQGHALTLNDQVVTPKLWPTPTERDWKSTSHGNQGNSRPLSEVAGQMGQGSLSPEFVEVLMGFPIGHTRLRPNESRIDHTALKP